jgi:hypothetical protein
LSKVLTEPNCDEPNTRTSASVLLLREDMVHELEDPPRSARHSGSQSKANLTRSSCIPQILDLGHRMIVCTLLYRVSRPKSSNSVGHLLTAKPGLQAVWDLLPRCQRIALFKLIMTIKPRFRLVEYRLGCDEPTKRTIQSWKGLAMLLVVVRVLVERVDGDSTFRPTRRYIRCKRPGQERLYLASTNRRYMINATR